MPSGRSCDRRYLLQKGASFRARKTVKEVKYPVFMPTV